MDSRLNSFWSFLLVVLFLFSSLNVCTHLTMASSGHRVQVTKNLFRKKITFRYKNGDRQPNLLSAFSNVTESCVIQ